MFVYICIHICVCTSCWFCAHRAKAGRWLLPQQQTVAALVHPESPVKRVHIDHNTGSGKTLFTMASPEQFLGETRTKVMVVQRNNAANVEAAQMRLREQCRRICKTGCSLGQQRIHPTHYYTWAGWVFAQTAANSPYTLLYISRLGVRSDSSGFTLHIVYTLCCKL